jgi:hypothetical protein
MHKELLLRRPRSKLSWNTTVKNIGYPPPLVCHDSLISFITKPIMNCSLILPYSKPKNIKYSIKSCMCVLIQDSVVCTRGDRFKTSQTLYHPVLMFLHAFPFPLLWQGYNSLNMRNIGLTLWVMACYHPVSGANILVHLFPVAFHVRASSSWGILQPSIN